MARTYLIIIFILSAMLMACSGNQTSPKLNNTGFNDSQNADIIQRAPLSLELPSTGNIPYEGEINLDAAGLQSGGMAYPANDAAGFAVAVLTHAIVTNSVIDNQKHELRENADKVLDPFDDILNTYTYDQLMQNAINETTKATGKTVTAAVNDLESTSITIKSKPQFLMSQDKSTLILDNSLSLFLPGHSATADYSNVVRVISAAQNESDLVTFWKDNSGEKLKKESAKLFALSIAHVINILSKPTEPNTEFKTFHYKEGGIEKMERGQLLDVYCGRTLIKNLRGWFISIPADKPQDTDACMS